MAELQEWEVQELVDLLDENLTAMAEQYYKTHAVMIRLRRPRTSPPILGAVEVGGAAYAGLSRTEDGARLLALDAPECLVLARPGKIRDPERQVAFWQNVRNRWASLLATIAANARLDGTLPPDRPLVEAGVVWIRPYFGDLRLRDVDNMAVKAVVDALRAADLLAADDQEHMAYVVAGAERSKTPGPFQARTRILVVETPYPQEPERWPRWTEGHVALRRVKIRNPRLVEEQLLSTGADQSVSVPENGAISCF